MSNLESNSASVWTEGVWRSPEDYMSHLIKNTNYISSFSKIQSIISEKIDVNQAFRIADIGCGYGWSTHLLSNWFPAAAVDGIDPYITLNDQSINSIINILKLDSTNANFSKGTFEDLSIVKKKYDLIIAVASLHHSLDLRNDLQSISSTLKKNGLFIVSNEHFLSRRRYEALFLGKVIKIYCQHLFKGYNLNEQKLSQGRMQYNSKLGDWIIKKDYLLFLAQSVGLTIDLEIQTDYYPYRFSKSNRLSLAYDNLSKLYHLIFKNLD